MDMYLVNLHTHKVLKDLDELKDTNLYDFIGSACVCAILNYILTNSYTQKIFIQNRKNEYEYMHMHNHSKDTPLHPLQPRVRGPPRHLAL